MRARGGGRFPAAPALGVGFILKKDFMHLGKRQLAVLGEEGLEEKTEVTVPPEIEVELIRFRVTQKTLLL